MKAKLESMKYNALNFPKKANPMNNWGNSQMCRFLDGEVMIFNYDKGNSEPTIMKNGEKGVWGDLSVLNYGVLNRLFPCDNVPTLTLEELGNVYKLSNNIAFRFKHFFVLENRRDAESRYAALAVQDWVDALITIALSMTVEERDHARSFSEGYSKLGEWDVENSRVTHNSSILSSIFVDLSQDDQEDAAVEETTIDKSTGKPVCADVHMTNDDLLETVSSLCNVICMLLNVLFCCADQRTDCQNQSDGDS